MANFYVSYPIRGSGGSSGVTSLNSLTGAVVLAAGSNITITPSGNTLTIASTGGASYVVNEFTLSGTDISNKFVTLTGTPTTANLTLLNVIGGPMQDYGNDYVVSGSQLSWSGLFLDGVLVSGDKLVIQFS